MGWDQDLLHAINPDHPVPVLDAVMVAVSLLGFMVPYALLGFVLLRPGRRADAITFWIVLVVTEILVFTLKEIIDRPRPEDVRLLMSFSESASMPSGHAARAVAGAVALWRLGPRWRIPMATFAVLTLVSRVYVGAHYPSDVIVGALIGLGIGLIGYAGLRWFRHELEKTPEERSLRFARLQEVVVLVDQIDYFYSLRLVGRLTHAQADRFARVLPLWGRVRFLGPIVGLLVGVGAYIALYPELLGATASCLGTYFVPVVGIEIAIPLCLHLGIKEWLLVVVIVYLDLWFSLFLILNFDFLHKVPRLGPWLLRREERGIRLIRNHPWIMRVEFLGLTLIALLPIPGAGVIPGVLVGRFLGMPRWMVWLAVMIGTSLRITFYVYSFSGLLRLLP
jgi:undecaprenyl-diphosphatase